MRIPVVPSILLLVCVPAAAQTTTPDVGAGAPTESIRQSFISAYFRNGFNNLVTSPPLGNVKALGSQGLVQEFADAKNSSNKYALCKPNVNAPPLAGGGDMVQFYPTLYAYYTSVGPNTAGYPTTDTVNCPNLNSLPSNSCQYQLFDKPYALFAFKTALLSGSTNIALADPFFTKWQSLGGVSFLGPATSASASITSASAITANLQTFDQGGLFNMTSGTLSGRLITVSPGVYPTYSANGGYLGFLGLPIADEILLASGHKRQTFENGSIEYDPATGMAVLRYPIANITISATPPVTMNLGDTITLSASVLDPNGQALTDRAIAWTTSNSRVVSLQPNGLTVTVKAIGGGTATVTASGEGKASSPLTIVVNAPCCGIGEGAPTAAIQQAFQDAVARTHINIKLPATAAVRRSGAGYVQDFQDASTGAPYVLALADGSAAAYLVSGAILTAYQALGGPAGTLGYPAGDANGAGRQLFLNNAALAGSPVQLVSGPFLKKWAALGYETGPAGSPTSAATSVLTFRASMGTVQTFATGLLASAQTGSLAGQVFFVPALTSAAYAQAGGATGSLGLPIADEASAGGKRRQDFEGGYIDYAIGDAAAQIHPVSRSPLVSATPSTVLPGTRVRLAIGGFDPGSSVRVSITGQTDFTVKTDSGAYTWETVVPSNSKSGTIAIRAVDVASSALAIGSYTIKTLAETVLRMSKMAGDGQTGLPGAALAQPLTIVLGDSNGNPLAGVPVQWSASPGAQIVSSAAATSPDGTARATVRLPASDALALFNAQAGSQIVTFSAQAVHGSLGNFPKLTQTSDAGALLTSAAAIIRFYQNRGDLPTPNGFADPTILNQFLKGFCAVNSQGGQICDGFLTTPDAQQIPNLWRLSNFVSGNLDVSVENADVSAVRDFLGQSTPVLLAVGNGYVVATGVGADGSIAVMDPNPATALSKLDPSSLTAVVRLLVRTPPSRGFVLSGNTNIQLYSPAGVCGKLWTPQSNFFIMPCDGAQDLYELNIAGSAPYRITFTGLGNPASRSEISGSGAEAFSIARIANAWNITPQAIAFGAAAIVNAASFTPNLAPGGIFTVFGSGLARAGLDTTAQLDGVPLQIIAQSPFQVSGVLPLDTSSGTHSLSLNSAYGSGSQNVIIRDVAPAIFQVGPSAGAILNQNSTLNTPDNPGKRGEALVIFGTGLGPVIRQNQLSVVTNPVVVNLNGVTLRPAFAGLAPGFVGLYQVNVVIPPAIPPGLGLPLTIQQGDSASNPVQVTIQ